MHLKFIFILTSKFLGVNRRSSSREGDRPRATAPPIEVKEEPCSNQPPANLCPGILARDAVYGEVASLIAANESRPQFLMELFRELQSLHSDSQRIDALRSIQRIQDKQKVSVSFDIIISKYIKTRELESHFLVLPN